MEAANVANAFLEADEKHTKVAGHVYSVPVPSGDIFIHVLAQKMPETDGVNGVTCLRAILRAVLVDGDQTRKKSDAPRVIAHSISCI